jgi:hypothetical protein
MLYYLVLGWILMAFNGIDSGVGNHARTTY